MAEHEAKLTVAVPKSMAEAVAEAARELSVTRSDIVRRALASFLKQRTHRKLRDEFARAYGRMSQDDLEAHGDLAEEGEAGSQEALETFIGTEEEPWW